MENSRVGTFSSSGISALMNPKKIKTYIKHKKREISMGRQVSLEAGSRATDWGTFVEKRVFDLLPLEYKLVSTERLVHPTITRWTGAPDCVKEYTVADIKCPFSLTIFCDKIDALNAGLETYKDEFPSDYWQLVSNAILTNSDFIEAIIYVPYKEELSAIREMTENHDGDQNKVAWINWANDEDLPYLIEGMEYQNLNIFIFEVPKQDKESLTESVKQAVELLSTNLKLAA